MINTVEKKYSPIDVSQFVYIITYNDGTIVSVPHNEDNRHYQEILEWVENGGVIVDNGA